MLPVQAVRLYRLATDQSFVPKNNHDYQVCLDSEEDYKKRETDYPMLYIFLIITTHQICWENEIECLFYLWYLEFHKFLVRYC